jgi:mannan endo-1,4-beta-mannosidase
VTIGSLSTSGTTSPTSRKIAAKVFTVALALAVLVPASSSESTAPGTWSTGPPMSVERVWHAQTPLADGRILVASGQTNAGTYTNSAEVYDPATNSWTGTGTMNQRRYIPSAALLPTGKVLVAGGDTNQCGGFIGTAELYDPGTNSWSPTQSMPTPAGAPALALLKDGRVLLAGGFQTPVTNTCAPGANVAATRIYDPSSQTWSTAAPMLTARHLALATTLQDGRVLVAGGWSDMARLTSTEIYDPATDTWSPGTPMAQGHVYGTMTLLNDGRVLIVGGQTGANGSIAGAEIYDPVTNSWLSTGPMAETRENHAASLLPDGKVLVAGGLNASFFRTASAERYDPVTNQWAATAALPGQNSDGQMSLLPDGHVLLTGGQGSSGIANSTEIYDPGEQQPAFVTRNGARLLLDGQPYRPVGLNIYNANSSNNCWYDMAHGSTLDDALTAIGPGTNAIRAWFFQSLATTDGQRDWSFFDHTLAVARAHGVKVIATLANQWADCEPAAGYKDISWYTDGYKQPDPGGTVSYRDWVQQVAARYKGDPTILAWQLLNEPEVLPYKGADCSTVPESNAESILHSFASDISGVIKSIDPNHLVSLGTIGSGQCGAQAGDYETVMSVPTLDLCEFHDYTPTQLIPGDQWNGLQVRVNQCNELGKPLLVGELGVIPNDVGGTLRDRANVVAGKLCAQLSAGVSGALLWAWDKDGSLLNNFDIGPSDPLLDVLSPWSDPSHTCSPPTAPSGVVAAAGDSSAAVSWLAPSSDGGSPVSSYTVTSNPGGVTKTVPGSSTRATLTGLTNDMTYTFTVTATNAAGTSVPSPGSNTATPQLGNPPPAAATGTASATTATTISTGSDPAASGGVASSVTVPAGTAGGVVSVTQTRTSEPAPSGYQLGGLQVDITAPTASAGNPLRLVFTLTASAGQTPDTTEIYRAEGAATPTLVGDCSGASGQAVPDPCVADRRSVLIGGQTDIQVTVLASSASHWNSATPKPGAVTVSDSGYLPQNLSIQPGAYVNWNFAGKKSHSVTDSVGLATGGAPWFDSGAKSSGSYSFPFPAAGVFAYQSTVKGDSRTGSLAVPVIVTPANGHATTSFSVIWSTRQLSGYLFDLQYRFRPVGVTGWKSWTNWKTGTAVTSSIFVPNQGIGSYAFHSRLRNAATGRASAYSPDISISVS